jgi:hypothetical protein
MDGLTNEQEFAAGTDPTYGNSYLRVTNSSRTADGTGFNLQWQSITGKVYQVQHSNDIVTWTKVGTTVSATGPLTSTTVPLTGSPRVSSTACDWLPLDSSDSPISSSSFLLPDHLQSTTLAGTIHWDRQLAQEEAVTSGGSALLIECAFE